MQNNGLEPYRNIIEIAVAENKEIAPRNNSEPSDKDESKIKHNCKISIMDIPLFYSKTKSSKLSGK